MNRSLRNGLAVAVIHVALVASVGAKLVVDRSTYPRVWARTAPFDPDLPIRGRYVRLRLEVVGGAGLDLAPARPVAGRNGQTFTPPAPTRFVELRVEGDQLVAHPAASGVGLLASARDREGQVAVVLFEPLAYFIPEGVEDPSRRAAGEELWVQVTVPPHGPPRPLQLGVKKDGVLTPIAIR